MDADIPYGTQVIYAMGTEIYVRPPPPEWKPTSRVGRRPRDRSQRDALLAAAKVDGPCPYEIDADGEVKVDTGTVDTGTTGLTRAKLTLAHRHTGKVDTGEVKVNRPGWAFVPGKDADPGTWHKRQGPVQDGTQVIHAMGTEIYVRPPPPEWKPISLFESSDEEWG